MTTTGQPHSHSTRRQAAFIFVFITVVLDMIALGVTVPVLPKLILDFNSGNVPEAVQVNAYFAALWAFMQFIFAPLLGALSDRVGRRPIILLSNLGLGVDYIFMALAPSLSWLLVGRMISGITSSSYPTASAYVADVTPHDQRAGKFGMLGAAFGIGFIIGPAVGGLLSVIDLRLPFWVAAGFSLANTIYGFFVLPESLPRERRARVDWRKANPIGSLILLRSHPELTSLAIATILMALAHETLPNMFVLYSQYRYEWGPGIVGVTLALVGICSGAVQGGLVGLFVKRFGERSTMTLGLLAGAVGFAVFGGANIGELFLMGIPFIALMGLAGPSIQSLMSRRVQATEQGQLQGALGSIRGIVGVIGPLLIAPVFKLTAGTNAIVEMPGAVYFFAALLLVVTLGVTRRATQAQEVLAAD